MSSERSLKGWLFRHLRNSQHGQSIVEIAFVLPVLALLMFAAVDFGRLLLVYIATSNGAREGARQGTLYPGCLDTGGSTAASVQNRIRNNTDRIIDWNIVTPVVTYHNASVTPTPVSTPVIGGLVEVQVQIPYEPITPLVGPIIGNPVVSSSSSMVIEQVFACLTVTPTATFTVSPTPTATVGNTATPTATPPPGSTPTFTPTITATPTATVCSVPAAPVLTSVTRSGNTHTLTWSAASGASTYNVSLVGDPGNPIISGVTSTTTTDSRGGTHDHTYYITGVNICGTGSNSNQVQE